MLYSSPDDDQQTKTIIEDDPELNKIKDDARHHDRMAMVQALFVDEFPGQSWEDMELVEYDEELLEEIRAHKHDYDEKIQTVATERPIQDLAKIDLAILRLILHERETKKTPVKVLIDEGVELAKDFGAENSYAFVNAVLEKIMLPEGKNTKNADESGENAENSDRQSENVGSENDEESIKNSDIDDKNTSESQENIDTSVKNYEKEAKLEKDVQLNNTDESSKNNDNVDKNTTEN